jgi:hypothetical protein
VRFSTSACCRIGIRQKRGRLREKNLVLLGSCIACTEAKTTRSIRKSIHNKNDGYGCVGEDHCPIRILERAKGIEPSYAAWEAAVLPLNYARNLKGRAISEKVRAPASAT